MVEVDALDESLDLSALDNSLLGHGTGDSLWSLFDTEDVNVGVVAVLGAFWVGGKDNSLLTSMAALEHNDESAGTEERA